MTGRRLAVCKPLCGTDSTETGVETTCHGACTAGCQKAIDGVMELSKAPEESLCLLELLLEWSGVQQNAPVECRAAVLAGELQSANSKAKIWLNGHGLLLME